MAEHITPGVLERIQNAPDGDEVMQSQPVVQVLSIKPIAPGGAQPGQQERFRIIISDGQNYAQSMLATQLNGIVHSGSVGKQSVIRMTQFTVNTVRDKRLTIILGLEVLVKETEKVGNPQALDGTGGPAAAGASTSTTPAPQPQPMAVEPPAAPRQQPQQQQPPQQQQDVKPQIANNAPKPPARPTYPIASLSPYQNNWTLKARVVQKSEVRRWSNQKGEGQLFSVTLMDESGEIRATGFNAAVDDLYNKFVEGKVYYLSKAKVQFAKRKFSNVNNDYELTLERSTEVEECRDAAAVPQIKYEFIELGNLGQVEKDTTCDVIAIVKEVGDIGQITTKAKQTQLSKRELVLVDRTAVQTRLTLWGKQADEFSHFDQPVIAFKGIKVGDFGGRSLSMQGSASMTVNPDIAEAHALRGWYDAMGQNASFSVQAGAGGGAGGGGGGFKREEFRTIADVKDSELGRSDKVDYFTARATIVHIKPEGVSYPGCPTCNKKVTQEGDAWRCEKCDKNMPAPKHRYILAFAVADYSNQAWFQSFNDSAELIMGVTADDLYERRQNDESQFLAVVHRATFATYDFVCRAKQETYNENVKTRYSIQRIAEVDYLEEAKHMRDLLNSSWAA